MGILTRLGTLRVVLTVLTGITALYFALVVVGNITDFDTNRQFVRHVLAMDTTFRDPDVMWRSITNSTVVLLAYLAIIAWEALIALVLIAAFVTWIRSLAGKASTWAGSTDAARRLCTLGWTMVVVLFGGGFIAIGGEWFEMWQSKSWNGLQPALQDFLIASVGLILANVPESVDSHSRDGAVVGGQPQVIVKDVKGN